MLGHATNSTLDGFGSTGIFFIKLIDYCMVPVPMINLFVLSKWEGYSGPLGAISNTACIVVNLIASIVQAMLFMVYIS